MDLNNKKLGIFLKHNDYIYSKIKDVRFEFQMQKFQADIVIQAIQAFLFHQYKKFDALVGDCKCQVRVSILLDIIQENKLSNVQLNHTKEDLEQLKERLDLFIKKTEMHQLKEIQELIKILKNMNVYDFFQNNKLNYNIPQDVFLIVLFFFTCLKIDEIVKLSKDLVSRSRTSKLLHFIKKQLTILTIEYEQNLAKQYSNIDVQKSLEKIEIQGFCCMTAFYPSFIPIWDKIKKKKQLILKKTIFICECGGIININNELFRANDQDNIEKTENNNLDEASFVIEGYTFNGSFEKLNEKVHFATSNALMSPEDFKLCKCYKNQKVLNIENIDEAVLAGFAQHAQFTNGAEIDWQGLGLENSELKKEYDYLRTLPGYGINDMSKFCIVHIYASTVGQELEDQRELLAKLGKKE